MALSLEMTAAILAVGIAVFAIVLYLEMRYMKSRRKEKVDVALVRDDAYNTLTTTQAVSRALKDQGRDTKEADLLLVKSEAAYQRRDYLMCKELAEEARTVLRQTRAEEKTDTLEGIAARSAPEPEADQSPPLKEIKKLPQNYLESKFMIETARMCIEAAALQGIGVVEAEKTLAVARECYDRTEYTEALKQALRAKKTAEGQNITPQAEAKLPELNREEPAAPPIRLSKEAACGSCGQSIDEGDNFCRKCGAEVVRVPKCPSCELEVDESDAFCRRCGSKLK
ncbi:MAG: zinc ribbon domain-containing protein [Methanomassiliicoccales archaeon]|jgi:RNA polymerase subunit RPABC4/transcription elongation factor Spt4